MKIDNLLIIPNSNDLDRYLGLCNKYGCGFEYNDFFLPAIMDQAGYAEEKIAIYQKKEGMPKKCTIHGAFLDVTVFSDDPKIVAVSDYRVEESLSVAEKLGCQGVVFHTNYVANFKAKTYRDNWVKRNEAYWRKKTAAHPGINIYIENMFDDDPELLAALGEKMQDVANFGICFDYAHAHVFGNERKIEEWVRALSPYVKHLHINDNDFKEDLHLALGEGWIDWDLFKKYYEKYFSQASVLLEVSGYEKTEKSLEYFANL